MYCTIVTSANVTVSGKEDQLNGGQLTRQPNFVHYKTLSVVINTLGLIISNFAQHTPHPHPPPLADNTPGYGIID